MVLAPAQVGNNASTAAMTPEKRSAALLDDPVFAAIHNAFLLGSSFVELKGRVQITAFNTLLDGITFDKNTSTFIAGDGSASASDGDATQQQPNVINAVLKNIVLREVAQWLPAELRDNAWLTSELKSIYTQIVALHIKRFPTGTTANTIYDLPSPPEDEHGLSTYPFPHLYPPGQFDYANIGINSIQDAYGGYDSAVTCYVTNFKLYDVTRRALNCLTLLLDEAKESLIPGVTDCYQRRLVQAILAKPPIPTADPDCTNFAQPSRDDIKAAVTILGNQIIRFLEAWESFIRENYYLGTSPLNNDSKALVIDNEIELAAYEAGRSLAALSWNVSIATVPLETALTPEQLNDPDIKSALAKKAQTTWQAVFNDRDINHIQYQITALSTALDQAYYRVNPDIKAPSAGDPLTPLNPNLPSQAILAVKHSLDFWQRTAALLCSPDGKIKPGLNPSAAVASTLNSPASGLALDWKMSKMLRSELIQQASIWQSLILCQQGLQSYTIEIVTQHILNDFMRDLEQVVSDEIGKNSKLRRISLIVVAVIFGIIVLLVIAGLARQNFSLSGLLQSPLVIVTAIGALIAPFVAGIASWLNKLGSLFGAAGTATEQALQRGYDRMLIEFDYLNHNVSITYPLVEFFVLNETIEFDGKPIKDGYDCLVKVFWTGTDREEEFKRVMRAAFGPISAFIDAQLKVIKPATKSGGR